MKMFFKEINFLEYLAYIFLFALFIIVFTNTFYLCLLFDTLKLPSDPDAPDVPDDHNDPDEDLEIVINIETIYVILYLFYYPERVPYNQKIKEIGLIPYQRKKRPKIYENFFNSFLSVKVKDNIEEKVVKNSIGENLVKDNIEEKVVKDNIEEKIVLERKLS